MRAVRILRVAGLLLALLFVLTACGSGNAIAVGAIAPDFALENARGGLTIRF